MELSQPIVEIGKWMPSIFLIFIIFSAIYHERQVIKWHEYQHSPVPFQITNYSDNQNTENCYYLSILIFNGFCGRLTTKEVINFYCLDKIGYFSKANWNLCRTYVVINCICFELQIHLLVFWAPSNRNCYRTKNTTGTHSFV